MLRVRVGKLGLGLVELAFEVPPASVIIPALAVLVWRRLRWSLHTIYKMSRNARCVQHVILPTVQGFVI